MVKTDFSQLYKNLKFGEYLAMEAADPGSPFSRFNAQFFVKFLLANLDQTKQEEFARLVEQKPAIKEIWQFIEENITDWEKSYQKALKEEIVRLRKENA